jgi:uncharacterized peroxidase-related enzyme
MSQQTVTQSKRRTRRYRAQATHVMALSIPLPRRERLDPEVRKYFERCDEKLGFVPNVLAAYSFDAVKLRAFIAMYNDLMLGPSRLSKLEREMIAVVVSSAARCYYCLTAHGQAVRQLAGDPSLGETLVMNFRAARVTRRQRAMLEFVHKLASRPEEVTESDRAALRRAGFKDRAIWDIAAVAAFFSMTNRLATAVDMTPNAEYLALSR